MCILGVDEYRRFLYSFFMEVLFITKERENPINEQIRVKEMMVIGPNGEQLGVKSKQDALKIIECIDTFFDDSDFHQVNVYFR